MDDSKRNENYKTLINSSFKTIKQFKFPQDIIYEEPNKVKVYKGYVEAILSCDIDRLFKLLSDASFTTRSKWDYNLESCKVLETFDDNIQTVYFRRYGMSFVGVQWSRKYLIIFRTCLVPYHKFQNVNITQLLTCIRIKLFDNKKCLLTIMGGQEEDSKLLAKRILWMEHICNEDKLYYTIYDPWICLICNKQVPAHELECRTCLKERYRRCSNCKEAMREECEYCD